jgi:hypothetical protein
MFSQHISVVLSTALDISNWEPACEDLSESPGYFCMYLYHIYSYLIYLYTILQAPAIYSRETLVDHVGFGE